MVSRASILIVVCIPIISVCNIDHGLLFPWSAVCTHAEIPETLTAQIK